jgi:3-oxoacyl-[acyl-carrier protein] reductase
VAKKAEINRLFAESKQAFGALDILVNNAGIYEFVPLEDVTEEHFHRQFNLNVLGLILTTQEAVKQFGLAGAASSTSVPSPAPARQRPVRFTVPPRPPSMR